MALFLVILSLFAGTFVSGCSSTPGPPLRPVFNESLGLWGLGSDSVACQSGQALVDRYCPSFKHRDLAQKILATAYTQFGLPYRYAGSSPETGFDCSGFTMWAFAQHGIKLPRSSKDMIDVGVEVKPEDLRPGDLLVFNRYRDSRGLHVGIYVGDGLFIHSPHTGDRIKESEAFTSGYKERFISARRVLEDPTATPLPPEVKAVLIKEAMSRNVKETPKEETRTAEVAKDKKKSAARSDSKLSAKPTAKVSANSKKRGHKYEIKQGDTIWTVAKRFGVSSANLLEANNLRPNSTLRPGQKLSIPQ